MLIWSYTKDFRTSQNWEEDAMFYIVGKNFVDFGFWKTRLLDDYAVGNELAAHPMLYTHFPTISGIIQGLLQMAGIKDIHFIKLFFIPFFMAGMVYYYLVIRRLFSEKIALFAFAVTGTNYLAVLAWSDNTVHALHWLFLFGALYHYLSIPSRVDMKGSSFLHLFMAWFFIFISGPLTFIHTLFLMITIGLFHVLKIHSIKFKYLMVLFSAPLLLFLIHQIRIISLLGWDIWFYDQVANIRKSSDMAVYKNLVDFYIEHGIVLWPPSSGLQSLSFMKVVKLFYSGLKSKEGVAGIVVLTGLIIAALADVLIKRWRSALNIDGFGKKILVISSASIAWNFLFSTHASNYFNATPYIMLAGMVNLGWGICFAYITSQPFLKIMKGKMIIYVSVVILCVGVFLFQRVDSILKNPLSHIPGSEALHKYEGATFYSNIWPLFVSYYTKEWTVGGLSPEDAVKRVPQNAKWFLQKDKLNYEKYSKPDYYFYAYWEKVAPFTTPKHKKILDEYFSIVESGDRWCIYKYNER
jgi:hypothetical protein